MRHVWSCAVSKFSLIQFDYYLVGSARCAYLFSVCEESGRWRRAAIASNKIIYHFEHSTNTFSCHNATFSSFSLSLLSLSFCPFSIALFYSIYPQPQFWFGISAAEACSSCITAAFASFLSIIIIQRK